MILDKQTITICAKLMLEQIVYFQIIHGTNCFQKYFTD